MIEPIRGSNFAVTVARENGGMWHAGDLANALAFPDGLVEVTEEELALGVVPPRLEELVRSAGPDWSVEAVECCFTACDSYVILREPGQVGVIYAASWVSEPAAEDPIQLVAQNVRAAGELCVLCFGEHAFPDLPDDPDKLPEPNVLDARMPGQGFSIDQSVGGTARLIRGHRVGGRDRTWVEVRGAVTASIPEHTSTGAIADDGSHVIVPLADFDASRLVFRSADGTVRWETSPTGLPLCLTIDGSGAHVMATFRPAGRFPIIASLWSTGSEPTWSVQFPFVPEEIRFDAAAGTIALTSPRDGTLHLRLEDGAPASEDEALSVAVGDPFSLLELTERAIKQAQVIDPDAAAAALRRAIDNRLNRYPRFEARAWRAIGELAEAGGDMEAAINAYTTALARDPKVGIARRLKELELGP